MLNQHWGVNQHLPVRHFLSFIFQFPIVLRQKVSKAHYGKIEQEYARITSREEVTRVAQITINELNDYTRKIISENGGLVKKFRI